MPPSAASAPARTSDGVTVSSIVGSAVDSGQADVVPHGEQWSSVGADRVEGEGEAPRRVESVHPPARVVFGAVALAQDEFDHAAEAGVEAEGANGEVAGVPPPRRKCRIGEGAPHRRPVCGDGMAYGDRTRIRGSHRRAVPGECVVVRPGGGQLPDPAGEVVQRAPAQAANPPPAEPMHLDETGPFERLQVLGDLRLAQVERGRDLADRPRGNRQQLDDPKPVRLGESCEQGRLHERQSGP